jgi:hypothetical protein
MQILPWQVLPLGLETTFSFTNIRKNAAMYVQKVACTVHCCFTIHVTDPQRPLSLQFKVAKVFIAVAWRNALRERVAP